MYSWVVDTYFPDSDIAKLLQLGIYNRKTLSEDAIDTTAEKSQSTSRLKDNFDR